MMSVPSQSTVKLMAKRRDGKGRSRRGVLQRQAKILFDLAVAVFEFLARTAVAQLVAAQLLVIANRGLGQGHIDLFTQGFRLIQARRFVVLELHARSQFLGFLIFPIFVLPYFEEQFEVRLQHILPPMAGKVLFGLSLLALAVSLLVSLWEVLVSTEALNIVLGDMENRSAS